MHGHITYILPQYAHNMKDTELQGINIVWQYIKYVSSQLSYV